MRTLSLFSLIVPVYCEEEVLPEFYRRTKAALIALGPEVDYEIVFVNDGSIDKTADILEQFAEGDNQVKIIHFSRNFGHQMALTAGLDIVRGDAVVIIDADLQDPPEVIGELLAKWNERFDVVYAQRRLRRGENAIKLATAKIFYRVIGYLSDVPLPMDVGDFRLLDRQVVEALKQIREESRYMRGLVTWVGFKQCAVLYDRDARFAGKTKYSVRKMVQLAINGVVSFSEKPLRLSSHLGLIIMVLSLLYTAVLLVGKYRHPERTVPGWTSLMVIVLLLGGVQLLSVGLLGEYLGRVFRQTKGRPLYVVARRVNIAAQPAVTNADQMAAPPLILE